MAFAQGSRSRTSYITETTFGTTPAGNFQEFAKTSFSVNLTKDRVEGQDLQADRMSRYDRHGNRQVGGDLVVDLKDGDYDNFIASAMLSTWQTDAGNPDFIKVGTTPKFFSIEEYATDIDQARLFTGCTVSSMAVSLSNNQTVQTTFGIVGKDMAISATEKTTDAQSTNQPFDAYSGDLAIGNVGASSSVAIVSALDFTVNNDFTPAFVIGDDAAAQLSYGMASVEGNLTVYYQDADVLTRFLDETETEISVSVADPAGNTYTFLFPRVKINGGEASVTGPKDRFITMPFKALYDETEGSSLVIYRPETV